MSLSCFFITLEKKHFKTNHHSDERSIILYFSGKLLFPWSFLVKILKKGTHTFETSLNQPVKKVCKHRDSLENMLREVTDFDNKHFL